MKPLRVLLADDHAVLLEGLGMLIAAQSGMTVVAQARGGREAIQLCACMAPDIVVLDVSMPDMDGADVTRQLRAQGTCSRVVALTRHADQGYLRRMLRAGAAGYVLKRTAPDALIHAIRIVADGGTYIDASLAGSLVSRAVGYAIDAPARAPRVALSEREEHVLRSIAWGLSNKEVAAKLGLSVKTVESYKASALQKLALRSRADILRYALAEGWLVSDSAPE
jgi:DNA-binding NarL/FixJ family response regulator